MSERRHGSRQHRRLPNIPTRRGGGGGGRDQLLSYRESENWLQRHQDVINKSVTLLEVHPKLIQHKACNKLWDFVSKVSICSFQAEREKLSGLPDKIEEESQTSGTDSLPIPLISVSDGDVNDRNLNPLIQRVYVCAKQDDVTWHPIIVGMCAKFLVTYCYHDTPDDVSDLYMYHDIHDDDVILFIIDNNTITLPSCLNLLKVSSDRGVRVIFLRHSDFNMPADVQLDLEDLESNLNASNNNNHKTRTRSSSGMQYDGGNQSRQPMTRASIDNDNTSHIRPDSGISMFSGRSSRCPEDKVTSNTTEPTTNTHVPSTASVPEIDRLFTRVSAQQRNLARSEIVDILHNGYNKAFIYDKDNRETCLKSIIAHIEYKVDQNKVATRQDSETSDVAEDSNKDKDIPPKPEQMLYKRRMSCRRESVDTVFFVYPSGMLNDVEPKLVRYPKDLETMRVPPSPSTESFGFQDIDLSVAINELDLFSTDEEEELH